MPPDAIQGRFYTDGMIQGKLPGLPAFKTELKQWSQAAKARHFPFTLEFEASNFSLLAGDAPRDVSLVEGDVAETLAELLRRLLSLFPEQARPALFSTVRSVEFREGQEVQTIYAITPRGGIDPQQRVVRASTVRPASDQRIHLKRVAVGAGAALLALAVLHLILPNGLTGLFRSARQQVAPVNVEGLQVDATAYDHYLEATPHQLIITGIGTGALTLTVRRGTNWSDLVSLDQPPPKTWRQTLALQNLLRGYVRCEVYDLSGAFLFSTELRIKELHSTNQIMAAIPLPERSFDPRNWAVDNRPAKVLLTY